MVAPEHWATVCAAVLIGPIITFTLLWASALSVWTTGTTNCSCTLRQADLEKNGPNWTEECL